MPASWIRACVLDDLVQAGMGGHEQITTSLLLDDGPFAFPYFTVNRQGALDPNLEEDLVIFNPCSSYFGDRDS